MTLTELKYIVAVSKEKHFGRAAETCFVSQPTLSVAIKKLEEELGVPIFERKSNEISVTNLGSQIIDKAEFILEQISIIKNLSKKNKDPLVGNIKVGVIHTIAPYLLPKMVPIIVNNYPQMPLILQENFTIKLLELLKSGHLDMIILAQPFNDQGLNIIEVYDEIFVVAIPRNHKWAKRKSISSIELKKETMLLLGIGHCFRDHVLEVCPEMSSFSSNKEGFAKTFEGSSLETIRHMVASGIGITVLPISSVPKKTDKEHMLKYIPFENPVPSRRIVIAFRKSFTRIETLDVIKKTILLTKLNGIKKINDS
tara:strand:+ start:43 stop:975 length:933 start_codon:yes stop_codon:yes gene_type:complete